MDSEQAAHPRGSIPRLSRLPAPRASNDNLRSINREYSHNDSRARIPGLPRFSAKEQHQPAAPSPAPLGESVNRSIRSRFGWPQGTTQNRSKQSPTPELFNSPHETTLDTTPPSSTINAHIYETGNENAVTSSDVLVHENSTPKPTMANEKRRPRPSLSERTVETLSQISPTPSPSRRRSSIYSIDTAMGPPSRPASSMRNSRPSTSHSLRPSSPAKRQFRPPGASSPTKDAPPMPALPLPSSIYTPPKAFMRDKTSRISKPLRDSRRSVSNVTTESPHQISHHNSAINPGSQTVKAKTTYYSRTVTPKTLSNKPSIATLFKDPPIAGPTTPKLAVSSLEKKPYLMRPRSFGENTLAPSASSSSLSVKPQGSKRSGKSSATEPDDEVVSTKSARSSAALRETIAQAKADAAKSLRIAKLGSSTITELVPSPGDLDPVDPAIIGGNRHLLRKRIQGATTTGHLNVAAMGLKQIPDEIMNMYELEELGTSSWAETVDLVKFVAADNNIAELRDDAFPDWSVEAMMEDDMKTNQFGGLEVLDLHGNVLQNIPLGLRRLERLNTLNLSNNLLTSDALRVVCQIKNLKELSIADNQLSSLPIEIGQLEHLSVLDVRGNALEALPTSLAQLKSLRFLKVSRNKLARLPFESLVDLPIVEIHATNNKLCGTLMPAAMEGIPTLRSFDLSFNSIEHLTSCQTLSFPALQNLALDGNRLSVFPNISSWQNLTTLTASENLLTEIPAGFTELALLKNADFSRNNIKLVAEAIASMGALSSLNLASNPLRDRKYLTMPTDDLKDDLRKRLTLECSEEIGASSISVTGRPELSTFKISSPTTRPAYLHNPVNGTLDLTSTNLTTLDITDINLAQPTKITTLKLSSTQLTYLPLHLLTHPSIGPHLHHLDLSHNPLHATQYLTSSLHLPNLLTLNIVSTGLTSLEALTLHLQAPQLRELNISCHRLTGHVPWLRALAFPNLRVLLATDNWFSSLDVEAVRGLEVLDVKNNGIDALPPKIGMLGHYDHSSKKGGAKAEEGKLRVFEIGGNKFRVPRREVVERGTESVLKDLRRMIPIGELEGGWKEGM